jgi:hypothetical protein
VYEALVPVALLVQSTQSPASRAHSILPLETASARVKPIVSVVALLVTLGTPVNDPGAAGAVRSIVQELEVPIALTLPAASVWRTETV